MKALVLTAYRRLELQDVPLPTAGPSDVLVRVRACGICGSDVHGYDGSTGRRIPPLVMGHEAAGVVAEVGADVDGVPARRPRHVRFDDLLRRVRVLPRRATSNLCDGGASSACLADEYRQHGAFAEFVAVPEHIVYPLPPNAAVRACGAGRAGVGRRACGRPARRSAAATVRVVVGSGMIGLLVIQACASPAAKK